MSDLKRISEESMNLNGEIFNHKVFSLSNIKFEVISNIIDIETKDNLILIHGLAGSSNIWYRLIETLSTKYNIYALDLPWNGKEELPYSGKDSLLMWFNNVIDSLNLSQGKTFLISHSFGATMSFHYYIHNSRNLDGMVLCAPIWKTSYSIGLNWEDFKGFLISFEKSLYDLVKLNHTKINDSILDSVVKKILSETSPRSVLSFIDCLFEIPNIENEKFDTPILLITGDKDQMVNPENSFYIKKMLDNSSIKIYDDVGHYTMFENENQFISDIILFLNENSDGKQC